MCVAAVGEVVEINETKAVCSFRGAMLEASIVLVPKVRVGDYVVVHAGFATEIIKDFQGFHRNTVATDAYARQILDAIEKKCEALQGQKIKIMNFCGSHERTIHQFGLAGLLPDNIELISGPGCPVCVTPVDEISLAMEACKKRDVILTIFGDMLNIPTPWGTLEQLKAEGAKIKIVHDISQALHLAGNGKQEVVHLAVGFETTAPSTGAAILEAGDLGNFSIVSSHRLTIPAMTYVLQKTCVDAVICPGNVAMVTGLEPFKKLNEKYQLPLIVTGFEPVDVLEAVLKILNQLTQKTWSVENQYSRVVEEAGNKTAKQIISSVFRAEAAPWRGLPVLPDSRLVLNNRYEKFDAEKKFGLVRHHENLKIDEACCCGEILQGTKQPAECPFYGKKCKPENPKGPCMISAEGACRIKYNAGR